MVWLARTIPQTVPSVLTKACQHVDGMLRVSSKSPNVQAKDDEVMQVVQAHELSRGPRATQTGITASKPRSPAAGTTLPSHMRRSN
jgi:hypothetical protein